MEDDITSGDTDPAQQLLMSLGEFQKTVQGARKRKDTLWSDECMNQLILGVELSLSHNWPYLVDAFTGAGRILQTYENADRVCDALPFLENSCDILRAVAGDVANGKGQGEALDQWQLHYDGAVKTALESGMKLVDDADEEEGAAPDESRDKLTPFNIHNIEVEPNDMRSDTDGELPTLDELRPLENMLPTDTPIPEDTGIDVEAEEVINAAQDLAMSVAPSEGPLSSPDSIEPSRTVVDIVDRICDELAELKERSPEDRELALEMIEGGIGALQREAKQGGFGGPMELCEMMAQACKSMPSADDAVDERFTEICFAFCGVFVEAMSEPASENVSDWKLECEVLIQDWASAPDESVPADVEPEAPAAPVVETVEHTQKPAPAQPVALAPTVKAESKALFEMAQQALASGDAEAAKTFALQAAAAIADDEVSSAQNLLAESETRLKLSLNATAEARSGVTESEKLVKSAASHVATGKRALGEAKERTASMAQDVVDTEEGVADIEAQIADLQAKRDLCVEQQSTANERMNEARGNESSVSERLDGQRAAEMEARKNLEGSRQNVKELQRNTAEIESAMEKAREELTRHRISLEDIRQTMGNPQTAGPSTGDSEEEMLF